MVWCELPHSLIKSNQVLPLGVGPEPKSTSPGQASVQICYSWLQLHLRDSLTSGLSQQRANPSESVFQQPHDELCILLSYYLVFSFDLSALLWPHLRKVGGETVWILTCSLMRRKRLRESGSVAGMNGHFAVISRSPTMKWPKNSTAGVKKKREGCPQQTMERSLSVSLPR